MIAILPHRLERIVVMAAENRWSEALEHLEGIDCEPKDDKSQLMIRLSAYGGTNWVAQLVKAGADPRYRDNEGDTALGECIHGSTEGRPTVKTALALLQAGADPNELTRGGNRILQLAIAANRPEFVALLLLWGADPNLCSPDPDRPNAVDAAKSYGAARNWAVEMLQRWQRE